MGKIKEPRPVKLIASIFTGVPTLLHEAASALSTHFGPVDYSSQVLSFEHTSYYEREFGSDLVRQILSFSELVAPESLGEIKHLTNRLELSWARERRRSVNLDPGYVALSKMVLATTKNYAHRVYLGHGIYAEATLHFRGGSFHPWEWTYPDYASPPYLEVFCHIREIYVSQLEQRVD
jgi:hypothetical protein